MSIRSKIDKLWYIYTIEIQEPTTTCNNVNNSHKPNAEKKKPDSRVYNVWIQLYKDENLAKLISGIKSQDSSSSGY